MAEVRNVDPVMEKPWQRAKRFQRYDFYRKSAFPPMQIEPMQDERARLAGQGMTPEQRALRKQWVQDQVLHHEAREVPGLKPFNVFRRIYRWPADVFLHAPIKKMFSQTAAEVVRYSVPKLVMAVGLAYVGWYHLKYNQHNWTRNGGVIMFFGRGAVINEEDLAKSPEKEPSDYFDRGFKSRKALLFKE